MTNNHKLKLNTANNHIRCVKSYGPAFGGSDLRIVDKCNENLGSVANIGKSYCHGSYVNGKSNSYQLFLGS
jgi:hypothetical protein